MTKVNLQVEIGEEPMYLKIDEFLSSMIPSGTSRRPIIMMAAAIIPGRTYSMWKMFPSTARRMIGKMIVRIGPYNVFQKYRFCSLNVAHTKLSFLLISVFVGCLLEFLELYNKWCAKAHHVKYDYLKSCFLTTQ